jgi:hypothetical protein
MCFLSHVRHCNCICLYTLCCVCNWPCSCWLGTQIIKNWIELLLSKTGPKAGLAKRQHLCQCHNLNALYKQYYAISSAPQKCTSNWRSTIGRGIYSSTHRLFVTLVTFLIRICKIPGSNPAIDQISHFSRDYTPGKCWNSAFFRTWTQNRPNIIIGTLAYFVQHYIISTVGTAPKKSYWHTNIFKQWV